MKKDNEEVRKKKVTIRMNDAEYDELQEYYKKTTCRQLSEYLRKIWLQKPVVVKYKNESADEILSALLKLKSELNSIGNNFNQAVHRLHTLDRIPEFRDWLNVYEPTRQLIEKKFKETAEWMHQIYLQWLPK